jgi:hypothetical protein
MRDGSPSRRVGLSGPRLGPPEPAPLLGFGHGTKVLGIPLTLWRPGSNSRRARIIFGVALERGKGGFGAPASVTTAAKAFSQQLALCWAGVRPQSSADVGGAAPRCRQREPPGQREVARILAFRI